MRHLELIADGVIATVKEFVAGALAGVMKRVGDVEERLAAIAPAAKGEKGEPGQPGEKGEPGEPGKEGAPGKDAAVDREALELLCRTLVAEIPKPRDGEPGKSVSIEEVAPLIAGEVAKAVAALPPPAAGKDGVSPEPVTIAGLLRPELQKLVDAIPRPKDGEPGKSFTIDEAAALLEPMVGEWALNFERRAQDVLLAAVERIPKPQDGEPGLGFDDMTIEDDGHGLVTLRFARGDSVVTHQMQIPWPEDRGVWKAEPDEGPYRRGNGVTWDGSWFIAQKSDPQGKPGESADWRLAVKRGREGKPGLPGKSGDPGKPGADGRDLTQLGFSGERH